MAYNVMKSDEQWRQLLGREQFAILRQAATERPWTGDLLEEHRAGTYSCGACNAELFAADTKFEAHCGWPSFYEAIRPDAVEYVEDRAHGMLRTEVRCANCGSHLGHIFPDAPQTPTGDRFCMNSLSLRFTPAEQPVSGE